MGISRCCDCLLDPTHLLLQVEPYPGQTGLYRGLDRHARGVGPGRRHLAAYGAAEWEPFPQRDFIIFLTFCVIFATLVLQGLSLPAVIRKLGLSAGGNATWKSNRPVCSY